MNWLFLGHRLFKYWVAFSLIFIMALFFLGSGYILLLMGTLAVTRMLITYSDRVGLFVFGRERYPAWRDKTIKQRQSTGLKVLFFFNITIWITVAIYVILYANVRLIDIF